MNSISHNTGPYIPVLLCFPTLLTPRAYLHYSDTATAPFSPLSPAGTADKVLSYRGLSCTRVGDAQICCPADSPLQSTLVTLTEHHEGRRSPLKRKYSQSLPERPSPQACCFMLFLPLALVPNPPCIYFHTDVPAVTATDGQTLPSESAPCSSLTK